MQITKEEDYKDVIKHFDQGKIVVEKIKKEKKKDKKAKKALKKLEFNNDFEMDK